MKLVTPDFTKYSGFYNEDDVRTYEKGSMIFKEGESGDCMYVVLEGEVKVYSSNKHISIIEKGDILGDLAIIDKSPRSASAEAIVDCKLALIDEYAFNFLVGKHPEFALDMLKVMASRLRAMNVT